MQSEKSVSLRQRKHAKTRVALAKAALKRLSDSPWSEISVRDLAEDALISEMTFYNYFPKKTDLFLYIMRIWSLEIRHKMALETANEGLDMIGVMFDFIGDKIEQYPHALNELRILVVQDRIAPKFCEDHDDLTAYEKKMIFPNLDGISKIPASLGFGTTIFENLKKAVESGELPKKTDMNFAAFSIGVIFHGVSIQAQDMKASDVKKAYRMQFSLLWNGLEKQYGGKK